MRLIAIHTILFLCITHFSAATHMLGGYIYAERVSENSPEFIITLVAYSDTEGVDFGLGFMSFGDSTDQIAIDADKLVTDTLDNDILIHKQEWVHTFPGQGQYIISFREENRVDNIINMDNSVNTPFYIESKIIIDPNYPDFSSPVLFQEPILFATSGLEFTSSFGAFSTNDYKLRYELIAPRQDMDLQVLNYQYMDDLRINPLTGLINWSTKNREYYETGRFSVAVKIKLFDENRLVGYNVVDVLIVVEDGDSECNFTDDQDLNEYNQIFIGDDDITKLRFLLEDDEARELEMEVESELEAYPENFSFTTYDSTENRKLIKVGVIEIKNNHEIERDNPYLINVRGKAKLSFEEEYYFQDLNYALYTREVEDEIDLDPVVLNVNKDIQPMQVFPNPASEYLQIKSPYQSGNLYLFDLKGNEIGHWEFVKDEIIDISEISGGTYLYEIPNNGKESYLGKIIIK